MNKIHRSGVTAIPSHVLSLPMPSSPSSSSPPSIDVADRRHRRGRRRPRHIGTCTRLAAETALLLLLRSPASSSLASSAAAAATSDADVKNRSDYGYFDLSTVPLNPFLPPRGGPIEDIETCDVERLERANDSQLHVILSELANTAFFRTFAVDLDEGCPLAGLSGGGGAGKKKKKVKKESAAAGGTSSAGAGSTSSADAGGSESESESGPTGRDDPRPKQTTTASQEAIGGAGEGGEGEGCASEGLPDLDPDAGPACGVDAGGVGSFFDAFGGGGGFASSGIGTISTSSGGGTTAARQTPEAEEEEEEGAAAADDGDDEFECSGGSEEEDDDAEPLCSVTSGDDDAGFGFGFGGFAAPPKKIESAALHSLSERVVDRFESESQRDTFDWDRPSDPVVIDNGGGHDKEPCDDEALDGGNYLPETFWLDMCSNIKAGDGMKFVNLQLNPERNTGYNGTHVWNAIYEENCLSLDGSPPSAPMCYEERVLYRLLSGMHASTTLSIAKNYYPPSKRKGRTNWEPNPQYFIDKFVDNPEHLRNLHFSYLVLLRALKKASPVLYNYDIKTGDILEDETAAILLRRLLDSTILRSCHDVFTAFDENLMFKERPPAAAAEGLLFGEPGAGAGTISLKENFKGVFHNISSILDCVQCQQCKLHGKMTMLGYGAALKILFTPGDLVALSLSRNELVAFVNTVAKLSESVREIRELTASYWATHTRLESPRGAAGLADSPTEDATTVTAAGGGKAAAGGMGEWTRGGGLGLGLGAALDGAEVLDAAVGAVSALASRGKIDERREMELVRAAFERTSPELMVLAKHYGSDLQKFLNFLPSINGGGGRAAEGNANDGGLPAAAEGGANDGGLPDAIVVGTGLAGLAATLNILDRGGRVVLIDKEHRMGGNSNKASSGINACCPQNSTHGDYLDAFEADTIRSAGESVRLPLIKTLVSGSESAVAWLKERVGVDLSVLAQLGGHAHKRTHRPNDGMVGAEIIYNIQKAVKKYEQSGAVRILLDTKVMELIKDDRGAVVGVEVVSLSKDGSKRDGTTTTLLAPNTVLATGGFASDRSQGSYLEQYRPELMGMPATAGEFSTGDGIALGTAVGAGTVDMDKVQIHPTGWVDPTDPSNPGKILAGELMRGVGGILINRNGERFCNELGTRAYVTDRMFSHDPNYVETKQWNITNEVPTFSLVLSSESAEAARKHVDLYSHKGLLHKLEGIDALAEWMSVPVRTVKATLEEYQIDAQKGTDRWDKTSFRGVPRGILAEEVFYAGLVTPVLHYCMGGITIDKEGNVLDEAGGIMPGLHAAGEVSGGVHGNNRLGGNSLLECTVFGTIVGMKIPIKQRTAEAQQDDSVGGGGGSESTEDKLEEMSLETLGEHNTEDDLFVAIHGKVYDLTDFAEEHPAGAESIYDLAGQDGTEAFQAVHSEKILEDFDPIGILVSYYG